MSKSSTEENTMPEDFSKLVYDLVNDILFTFPEYKDKLNDDLKNVKENQDVNSVKNIYEHLKKVLPERFFDILYKNEEMFNNNEINTEFLPGIDFKQIWKEDISDNTKNTIWKYLQLILFTVIGKVDSHESFGDTAKLFEAINEDELKGKLEETMKNLQNMMGSENVFDASGADMGIDMDNLPKPEQIQDHINGLLDGKLGQLAKEIAEETAEELNLNTENASSVNDVFKQLFQNPGKLMNLVKNVGGKLDSKIKSGEIKESEIMQEASDLLNKMKDMPGMGDIQSMMKKMGVNMGKGQRVNMGAMQDKLNQNMRIAKMKERMAQRAVQKEKERKEKEEMEQLPPRPPMTNAEIEELVFSIEGDKPEKSSRNQNNNNNKKKKKKKGKK